MHIADTRGFGTRATTSLTAVVVAALCLASGCGEGLYVGSDLYWTARHEGPDLGEWTGVAGGRIEAPPPNTADVSTGQAHTGGRAARLTITTSMNGVQATSTLVRAGNLPIEAYYSAWYYLPQSVSVGFFWVIMKFRVRATAADPSTAGELYDLDLRTLPGGAMSLRVYDHRRGGDLDLQVSDPVVPVGRWFHVEAFYRNASDASGRLIFWLDEQSLVDITGPMAPNPWVGWEASSVAQNLMPATAVLYVDDAAISRVRVGRAGKLLPN